MLCQKRTNLKNLEIRDLKMQYYIFCQYMTFGQKFTINIVGLTQCQLVVFSARLMF